MVWTPLCAGLLWWWVSKSPKIGTGGVQLLPLLPFPLRDHLLSTANIHIIYLIAQRVFERTNWSNFWIFMLCLFIFRDWKTHIFCSRPQTSSFTDSLKTSFQIHWEITFSSEGCSGIIAAQYYLPIFLVGFPLANWELIFSFKKKFAPSSPFNYSGFLSLALCASYRKKSQMSKMSFNPNTDWWFLDTL